MNRYGTWIFLCIDILDDIINMALKKKSESEREI